MMRSLDTSLNDIDLKIKWLNEKKAFFVSLKGKQLKKENGLAELGHRIPIEVAKDSKCCCGATLQLGDYSVHSEKGDFVFSGEFYCPACNETYQAKKGGLMDTIKMFFRDLRKIEIKATGVSIER